MQRLIDKSKQLNELITTWIGIITALSAITAGLFSANQYLDHKQAGNVERTLGYVQRFNDGGYAEAGQILDGAIHQNYEPLSHILKDSKPAELEKKYSAFILDLLDQEQRYLQLTKVFSFHQELIQCIDAEICEADISRHFFANNARDLIRTFYPFICSKRAKWNDPSAYARLVEFYNGSGDDICQLGA